MSTSGSGPMATPVVMDSHRHFSTILHVADVKISPAMTSQPKWSMKSLQFTFVYVSEIATNAPAAAPQLTAAAPRLTTAFGDHSNGTLPTSNTSSAMTKQP